jgi:hypothetical protein
MNTQITTTSKETTIKTTPESKGMAKLSRRKKKALKGW